MKPSQQFAAMALAGLCGTAYSLPHPQVPFYTSRFPQHPQNLGYSGDYPKYWQGEAYSPRQETPSYYSTYNPAPEEQAPAPVEARPSFTERKYPAREAIKYYGGSQFPTNEEDTSDESNKKVQNVKIKNDNPSGDNDNSFTRITKTPGLNGLGKKKKAALESEEESAKKSGGLETLADLAVPEFNGAAEIAERKEKEEEEGEPENWSSFAFGVVSDNFAHHDPYEDREGDFARKTNAISKIERMMGKDYGNNSKNKASLSKRDWPEHIQEKALKMMDSASSMQNKGQKTIDNDPSYQESLRAKNPALEPPKSTFPVAPKSKEQAPKQPQGKEASPPPPKKKAVGSGGGDLVPSEKSGKLGRTKGKAPPPQQQAPRPQPNQKQPNQQQQPRPQKSSKSPRPPPNSGQPRQPVHRQPTQPNGDMSRRTGNKQPQQGNFPVQDLPRKGGSGLNTPNGRPQNAQKKPQNGQKKPQQNKKQPKQKPQNLRKRQVPVPAGPGYPPGTTIIRRPYVANQAAPAQNVQNFQAAAAAPAIRQINDGQLQNQIQAPTLRQINDGQIQNQNQAPTLRQISDGQIQRQYTQQVAPAPAPAPVVQRIVVPAPPPIVVQQTVPAPAPVQQVVPVQQVIPVQQVAPVQKTETAQFTTIVHPGKVICPENKPCPPPQPEYVEKTVLQPVQRIKEVPVTRQGVRAVPKLEAVDVVREVDVVTEKQVIKKPVCESCEQPKTITVCAACREAVDECECDGGNGGRQSGSFSKTYSNGKEAISYDGPSDGPVSGAGGLEAFFRQKMPEAFN